ncbi:hypothetical protein VaNZ11_007698 [Volvox africanus]|uniref:PIH1D1/2/3 CS-like domain-containing protein n=1 Tax=Volvox africanus TaxID=51714 RepID=A0ABQ5S3N4_9CHLO|nr:hypothetical protein VaNZ11_007698 [Volvox africanus]
MQDLLSVSLWPYHNLHLIRLNTCAFSICQRRRHYPKNSEDAHCFLSNHREVPVVYLFANQSRIEPTFATFPSYRAKFIHATSKGAGHSGRNLNTIVHSNQSIEKGNNVPSVGDGTHRSRRQGKGSGTGFNYSKALHAALDGAGSSATSRGDGKFQDGGDFAVSDAPGGRAKFVHLIPEALAPGNAERTIQQLDQLQVTAGRTQRGPAVAASVNSRGRTGDTSLQYRSVQQQHAAALAAAANILYDINDEDTGAGHQAAGSTTSGAIAATEPTASLDAAAAAVPGPPAECPRGLRTPEYVLRELPGGTTGHGQLEVSIVLPSVSSPGEVDVWLSTGGELQVAVPGKYHLKLELPHPVHDDTSHAKWSKAKKLLTLTLTKRMGQ